MQQPDMQVPDRTGNMEVVVGDEKVDVGLAVKSGRGPLCVPDYTKPAPSGTGWQYSQALAAILTQYKARGTASSGL
jgi:hypothetical protein